MFFLILIIIISILTVLVYTIKIKIVFKSFIFDIPKSNSKSLDEKNEVRLKLYIFGKIKIIDVELKKVNLKNKNIDKIKNNFLKEKNNINIEFITKLKDLKIGIENFDFKILIGLEDAALTAIVIGIVAIFLGNLFNCKKYKDVKYIIKPVYESRNVLNINFKGIIVLDFWNIISIVYNFNKGRVDKYDRTSNRRTYGYSNE